MRFRRPKYRPRTKPWKHQRQALQKVVYKNGGALFMEMGTGKTWVYINFAQAMKFKRGAEQVLVLATKSVIESVWGQELDKHAYDWDDLEWWPMNYEALINRDYMDDKGNEWEVGDFDEILEWVQAKPTVLICDEVHKIRRHTTKTSKAVYRISQHCVATIVGTGTPIGKWHLDLFGIFRVIDDKIFGSSFRQFKLRFAQMGGYGGWTVLRLRRRKTLVRLIKPWTYVKKAEDCLDLPPNTHQVLPVTLDESSKTYRELAEDAITYIEDKEVVADNILARLIRLSQVTGGHIRDSDGDYHRVGREKLSRYQDLLQELWDNDVTKVVVFCRFLRELRDCHRVAQRIGYRAIPFYGASEHRDLRVAAFQERQEPIVFIAQISTGSLGIDLTAARHAIFYSHSYSFIDFQQACGRLHRASEKWTRGENGEWLHDGKEAQRVTYYHLLAEKTVDQAVWLSLKTKREFAKMVLEHPELLQGKLSHD